ncbi:hypothetical protein ACFLR2_01880, partial [Chlamydiota bacterium]
PETDCLELAEWETLLRELPEATVFDMFNDIFNQGIAPLVTLDMYYSSFMALSRLIRHAGWNSHGALLIAQNGCGIISETNYIHLDSPRLLKFLSSWIHAITALMEKCSRQDFECSMELITKQMEYTTALTGHVLNLIKDDQTCDRYCDILTDLLGNDEIVVGVMLAVFLKWRNNSFHHSLAAVRLVRYLSTVEGPILEALQEFCVHSTYPELLNYDFDRKCKITIQWLFALSGLSKKCAALSQLVPLQITQPKIGLTKELARLVVKKFEEENNQVHLKPLWEALNSKDPEVAQALLETLPDIPALAVLKKIIISTKK